MSLSIWWTGDRSSIERSCLRQGSDQPVEIAGLEFVGVLGEQHEIADAVKARPRLEQFQRRQRGKRGEAPSAAAANDEAGGIGEPAFDKMVRGGGAILDIDDAPLPIEPLAIGAAIPRRSGVIYVDDADATAGPPLNAKEEMLVVMLVGPPCDNTTRGGKSPEGPSKS